MTDTTTTTPIPATLATTDAILPANARIWVYRAAIALGAVIFAAAIILDATGHSSVDGVRIDTSTGIVALILSALGTLAHANLSTGPGILAAIESEEPKMAEVIVDVKSLVKKAKSANTTVKQVAPDLETMLVADLKTKAKTLGLTGYSSMKKADLIAAIKAATKA